MSVHHAHDNLQVRIGISSINFHRRAPTRHAHLPQRRMLGVMGHHRATIQIFRQNARQLGRVRRFVQTAAYHNAHMLVRHRGKSPKNPLQ